MRIKLLLTIFLLLSLARGSFAYQVDIVQGATSFGGTERRLRSATLENNPNIVFDNWNIFMTGPSASQPLIVQVGVYKRMYTVNLIPVLSNGQYRYSTVLMCKDLDNYLSGQYEVKDCGYVGLDPILVSPVKDVDLFKIMPFASPVYVTLKTGKQYIIFPGTIKEGVFGWQAIELDETGRFRGKWIRILKTTRRLVGSPVPLGCDPGTSYNCDDLFLFVLTDTVYGEDSTCGQDPTTGCVVIAKGIITKQETREWKDYLLHDRNCYKGLCRRISGTPVAFPMEDGHIGVIIPGISSKGENNGAIFWLIISPEGEVEKERKFAWTTHSSISLLGTEKDSGGCINQNNQKCYAKFAFVSTTGYIAYMSANKDKTLTMEGYTKNDKVDLVNNSLSILNLSHDPISGVPLDNDLVVFAPLRQPGNLIGARFNTPIVEPDQLQNARPNTAPVSVLYDNDKVRAYFGTDTGGLGTVDFDYNADKSGKVIWTLNKKNTIFTEAEEYTFLCEDLDGKLIYPFCNFPRQVKPNSDKRTHIINRNIESQQQVKGINDIALAVVDVQGRRRPIIAFSGIVWSCIPYWTQNNHDCTDYYTGGYTAIAIGTDVNFVLTSNVNGKQLPFGTTSVNVSARVVKDTALLNYSVNTDANLDMILRHSLSQGKWKIEALPQVQGVTENPKQITVSIPKDISGRVEIILNPLREHIQNQNVNPQQWKPWTQPETTWDDNVVWFNIAPPPPPPCDLSISEVSFDPIVQKGGNANISATLNATEGCQKIPYAIKVNENFPISSVINTPGPTARKVSHSIKIDADSNVCVIVDQNKQIHESNENNNKECFTIKTYNIPPPSQEKGRTKLTE